MNTAVTFDTHEFIRTLESAGMPTEQAEAISSAVRKAQANADVATKGDVSELRAEVKADIRELSAKVDLIKWLLGIVLVAVIVPLIKSIF